MNVLTIPGPPIALKRPRFSHGSVFDSQAEIKSGLKWIIKSQWNHEPLDGPIFIDIKFHFPIPKSWSKKKREELTGKPHVNTPDLDNCIKLILDVMNEVVFVDDRLVYSIRAEKIYSEKAKTIVEITNAPTQ